MWAKLTDMSGKPQLLNLAEAKRICAIPGKGTRIYFSKAGEVASDWDFTDVKEDLNHFISTLTVKRTPEDAPVRYDTEQARAWATGWNDAINNVLTILKGK